MKKPATSDEATDESRRWAHRGERGQRAWKEQPRGTWETRQSSAGRKNKHERDVGMHNYMTCPGRESDRLVVAKKRVTTVERRGLSVDKSR